MGAGGVTIRLCAAVAGIKKMINTSKIYKMRIVFHGAANGSPEQDERTLLRRQVQNSGLKYVPVKGNPGYARISYGPSVGREIRTEREYADLYFWQPVSEAVLRERLSDAQAGLEVLEAYRVPYNFASIQNLASAAAYRVEGDFSVYTPVVPAEIYFNAPQLKITRRVDNGMSFTFEAKPFIYRVQQIGPQEMRLVLQCVAEKWISPQELIAAWLEVTEQQLSTTFQFIREGLFWKDTNGTFYPL